MSSFKEKLSKSVLDARAQNLYELTKIEEDRFVQDCKLKVLRIQGEINKHNDFAVKSRDSLNPAEWVKTRHELARKLRVAKIELALAMQVDEEEFPADATESINLDDATESINLDDVKGDITNPLDN